MLNGVTAATGIAYPDMPEQCLWPWMSEDFPCQLLFQLDGASPHIYLAVRTFLDNQLPRSWIGHGGLSPWPPRPPDLSPLDLFFWHFIKDCVYRPPLPQSLRELQGLTRCGCSSWNSNATAYFTNRYNLTATSFNMVAVQTFEIKVWPQ